MEQAMKHVNQWRGRAVLGQAKFRIVAAPMKR